MLFKVRPDVLDGVQLRGVGRQTLDLNSTVQPFQIVSDQTTAMGRQAIPEHQQRSAQLGATL